MSVIGSKEVELQAVSHLIRGPHYCGVPFSRVGA